MKDAIRQAQDGIILDLEVSANAKKNEVHGYNPWRRRIEVKLAEQAQKGKANAELIMFFSTLFNINSRDVQIIAGLTSSKKSLKITGISVADAVKVLSQK